MSELLDRARAYGAAGEHAKCAATYEAALADPSMAAGDRVHVLSHLSAAYRLADRLDDAIRAARDAVGIAISAADRRAEAHAQLTLASARLALIQSSDNWEAFDDVMSSLDRSASIYEQLGSIALGATLLTMADALTMADEPDTAWGIYARVTRDLSDARWASPESNARHADYVRGRAFVGLAEICVRRGLRDEAVDHFEAGVSLLVASRDATAAPILHQIADWFESDLSDPTSATRLRRAARALLHPAS